MTKKVKLAVLDKDLKARTYKKFPVTEDGTKILVKSGGKANFNPSFDNDSFVEFPRRSLFPPWGTKWDRVYIATNGAENCINFRTETIPGPDRKTIMDAAGSEMLRNIGKEKAETPLLSYLTFFLVLIVLLKVLGVIV